MKPISIPFTALVFASFAAVAFADDHIVPKAAFADTSYETQRTPVYAINGEGIDEATGTHDVAHQGKMWMGKNSGNTGNAKFAKWFVVDLGAVYSLDRMKIWNFNMNNGASYASRGVKQIDIYVSTTDSDFSGAPTFSDTTIWTLFKENHIVASASGTASYTGDTPVDFGGVSARWIGFWIDTLQASDAEYGGLSEVRFWGTTSGATLEIDETEFSSHKTFRIAGMDSGASVEKLPVLVRFDPSEMTFGRADHGDLAFTQGAEGNGLFYEVDTWTSTDAAVWVCLDTAERGASFTMHWGSANDHSAECLYTWPRHASVIHFNGTADDSARYAFTENLSSSTADGYVGGGASDAKTMVLAPFDSLAAQSKFAASMWIRPTSNSSNVRVMSSKETYGDGGFELIYVAGTGIYLRGAGSANTIVYSDGNNMTFPTGLWTHYTAVLDGADGGIYRNGEAMSASGSIVASSFARNANLSLGGYNGSDDSGNFSGAMDEFRLYNGVPSADWLKAEYQAMADANFLTTEAIPSTVVVTNATSSRTESRITVEGAVQLGDNDSQVTVVIGVGATDGVWDSTYELTGRTTGPFSYDITGLPAGIYYLAVGLAGIPDSWTESRILPVGEIGALEWTGRAGDNLGATAGNWDANRVPQSFDNLVFGNGVSGNLTVAMPSDVAYESIRVSTPNNVTFASEGTTLQACDLTLEEGCGAVTYSAQLVLIDDVVITVETNATLTINKISGGGDLTKRGPGTLVTTRVGSGLKRTGATYIEEGVMTFNEHQANPLGNPVTIGGCGKPAVLRWTYNSVYAVDPFDNESIIIKDKGVLDLSSNASTAELRTFSNISVEAGGLLKAGVTDIKVKGAAANGFQFEGDAECGPNAFLDCQYPMRILIPSTRSTPFVWNGRWTFFENGGSIGRVVVEDIPGVALDATFTGPFVRNSNWSQQTGTTPRLYDGWDKYGSGVMRVSATNNIYGGQSATSGRTRVIEGTLLLDNESGSATGAGAVFVEPGATLGGTGFFGGLADSPYSALTVAGDADAPATVHPGTVANATGAHVAGTLTAGSAAQSCPVSFNDRSRLSISVCGRGAVDSLEVNGRVTIADDADTALVIDADGIEVAQARGGTYTILSATEGIEGAFSTVLTPKTSWKVAYETETVDGTDVVTRIVLTLPGEATMLILQ